MQPYFSIQPKTRTRLTNDIFSKYCRENGKRYLDVEATFSAVRSTLCHLLLNEHYGPSTVQKAVADVVEKIDPLLDKLGLDSKKLEELQSILCDLHVVLEKSNGTRHMAEDAQLFCDIAILGRSVFEEARYDPNEFVKDESLALAMMMAKNFAAYQATVNDTAAT